MEVRWADTASEAFRWHRGRVEALAGPSQDAWPVRSTEIWTLRSMESIGPDQSPNGGHVCWMAVCLRRHMQGPPGLRSRPVEPLRTVPF